MTVMSDLPQELVEEILSRVPITSLRAVRSTRKQWNALSKKRIFGNLEANHQFLGFVMMGFKVCSVRFDLRGIQNDVEDFVDPSIIKQTGEWDNTRLVVWNPYSGRTRWIEPNIAYHRSDRYALGYEDDDNGRRNHKILRFLDCYDDFNAKSKTVEYEYEIYDLNSNSWKVLEVSTFEDLSYYQEVSLKGNSYMIVERTDDDDLYFDKPFLRCFDFTSESFGKLLDLPFDSLHFTSISSFRDEKLLALHENKDTLQIQILITTKIEPNVVSWCNFLKFDMAPHNGFHLNNYKAQAGNLFIDEEKKIALVFDVGELETETRRYNYNNYNAAYIIGENGFLKKVNLGGTVNYLPITRNFLRGPPSYLPLVCSSSYVPSLVEI